VELFEKLRILADSAKYDASCASGGSRRAGQEGGIGHVEGAGICHSYTPDGRCVSLLKILLTNYCEYDCLFCVNRVTSDIRRARFSVDEVVYLTMEFYRRNYIEGLFLSSGILQGPDYTMEQLNAVCRKLRTEHRFGGYIHLKVIPGCARELIEEAGRWADRVSANIELPTTSDLARLAPEKRTDVIEGTMARILEEKEDHRFAPAGQSTQMVIGATSTTDAQILRTAAHLYGAYKLRRIYYTAYSPFQNADGRLPLNAAPLEREHRLYQADWLIRHYDFSFDELFTPDEQNLSARFDPKLSWAMRHPEFFPVDLNAAPRECIRRVPGIGYRTVEKLLSIRRHHRLRLDDLRRLHVSVRKVRPFVTTADHIAAGSQALLTELPPEQLPLFDSAAAFTGEL
jgi:putative DNA modification/repair radical SAM protein